MKKLLVIIIMASLVLSSVMVYAKSDKGNNGKGNMIQNTQKSKECNEYSEKVKAKKEKKQTFKLDEGPVIKYGKIKLPLTPIQKGLGAKVSYDKTNHIITVTKGDTTVVIDLVNKVITVNGTVETRNVLTSSNSNKTIVLIKYLADVLGRTADVKGNKITIITPETTPTPTPVPTSTPAPEATPTPEASPTPVPVS